MLAFLLRRLPQAIPVIIGVSIVVFVVQSLLPGNTALSILGPHATPDNIAELNRSLGLDKSLPEQYVHWLGNVVRGDFGRSYTLNKPVIDELSERLWPTALLAGTALILCTIFGLVTGTVAAVRQYGWTDRILSVIVLVGISTPSFWLAMIAILVFAVSLGWFPTGDMRSLFGGGGVLDVIHHLVLPAVTLAVVATGVVARLTRANMLEVLRQDYVRTARAKGLSERVVVTRHAFRNALVSLIPIIGVQASFVLGGAVYIEEVFQWPGLGRMLVQGIASRDILLVQGGVMIIAVALVVINIITDLVQFLLDPRIGDQ